MQRSGIATSTALRDAAGLGVLLVAIMAAQALGFALGA